MKHTYVFYGCLLAGLAVVLGALGAHALKDRLTENGLAVFQTGVQYQFYHAVAIILTGMLSRYRQTPHMKNAFVAFLLGILFFSGSLYLMTIGRLVGKSFTWVGPVTPVGGVAFIVGWSLLALAFWRKSG